MLRLRDIHALSSVPRGLLISYHNRTGLLLGIRKEAYSVHGLPPNMLTGNGKKPKLTTSGAELSEKAELPTKQSSHKSICPQPKTSASDMELGSELQKKLQTLVGRCLGE